MLGDERADLQVLRLEVDLALHGSQAAPLPVSRMYVLRHSGLYYSSKVKTTAAMAARESKQRSINRSAEIGEGTRRTFCLISKPV